MHNDKNKQNLNEEFGRKALSLNVFRSTFLSLNKEKGENEETSFE